MTFRIFFLTYFFFVLAKSSFSQEQWASRVIEYSSQYSNGAAGASQALGAPNAYPNYGESKLAWTPLNSNKGEEFLTVEFSKSQQVKQIAIVENYNPGAIYQIFLIDDRNKSHKVYENKSIKSEGQKARVFNHEIEETNYSVRRLKLVLNTAKVSGINQIDAIGISSSNLKMEPKVNHLSYKNYSGKAENLGYNVNSKHPDFLPIISPDGKELYFVRKFAPENLGRENKDDIYIARKTNTKGWGYAKNIGPPLNDEHHNFVCAVSTDGNRILLSGSYSSEDLKGSVSYSTRGRNGDWSKPVHMPIQDDHNFSRFACFHVSSDWKYLVMAIQRRDSYGDMDLYVSSALPGNKWSMPRNLGPTINTSGMEASIFLAADGKTIYFSSNGRSGYGDLDMYMSRRLDNSWTNWTEPVNLGPNINTSGKDVYYTIPASGEYAYFSSERDSYGGADMFRIALPKELRPEPVTLLKASLSNDHQASVPKKDITVVVNDDQEELYDQVKGYYPVFKQADEIEEEVDEEEDDFENIELKDGNIVSKSEEDQKIYELRKKLQNLKKEQTSSTASGNRLNDPYEKYEPKTYSTDPVIELDDFEETSYTNSLDNRLAELRSQKTALERGERIYRAEKTAQPVVLKEEQTPFDPSYHDYKDRLEELRAQRDNKEFSKSPPKRIRNIDYDPNDPAIKYQGNSTPETASQKEFVKEEPINETWKEKMVRLKREEEQKKLETYEEKLARLRGEKYVPKQKEKIVQEQPERIIKDDVVDVQESNTEDQEIREEAFVPNYEDRNIIEDNDELSEENPTLKDDVADLKEEQTELAISTTELNEEREELQRLIDEMELERSKLVAEKERMEAERQSILNEREEQQSEMDHLQEEINQLLSQKGELVEDITKVEEQKKAYEEIEEEIFLMPLEVGSVIQINNIFFEVNSAFLKNESYTELNKVGAFLKVNDNIKVEIGGHTNGICSDEMCNKLSLDRAKSVMEYLIAQGIEKNRLSFNGYGKTKPIASNETLNGRKKNQRVELKIIDIE